MSLKKLLVSALCAVCAVSLLIPAAFAHGGHGRGTGGQAGTYRCAVCPVEGCTQAGRHYHNGTLYCGYNHANGWCDGTCASLCPVEGCTQAGRHYHNGTLYCGHNHANGWCDGTCVSLCPVEGCTQAGRHYHNGTLYCGANHAAGYCGGNCGYGQYSGSRGGCHGGRHCGW